VNAAISMEMRDRSVRVVLLAADGSGGRSANLWLANYYCTHDSSGLLYTFSGFRPNVTLSHCVETCHRINSPGTSVPDAGGRLIYQRLALAAVFGRPRPNFQEIVPCFQITMRFSDPIDSQLPGAFRK
jgi:hypothetical protein